MRALLAALIVCVLVLPAAAHQHLHHHHAHYRAAAFHDGRPRAWCGWYMRHLLGVADPRFNLARAWAQWGTPSSPGPGVVVVWPHHVGRILSGPDAAGRYLVLSGNDGHAVRQRYRSIAGAIAFRS